MKLNRKRDNNKCGIYCIRNIVNNKVYIGKSISIYQRILQHVGHLRAKSLDENRHLINAWHKYGEDNFEYFVLEYLEKNENTLRERELFWIQKYNASDRDFGYNLRIDTSTNCIVTRETRELQSINRKKRYKNNPNLSKHYSDFFKNFWKNNPDKKESMALKIGNLKRQYHIYQYDKDTKKLIKKWESIKDILTANPEYKRHNIYAVCSGEKPSMYGYIWTKIKIKTQTN